MYLRYITVDLFDTTLEVLSERPEGIQNVDAVITPLLRGSKQGHCCNLDRTRLAAFGQVLAVGEAASRSELRQEGKDRRYSAKVPCRGSAWWSGTQCWGSVAWVVTCMFAAQSRPLWCPNPLHLHFVIRASRKIQAEVPRCDTDRDR